ncbi:hypothetical protein KY332_00035 [Candidatus Woesearchaeota archaeon]|nr:hypothetical protein [Candidatus Woesearchaeota archaeon]
MAETEKKRGALLTTWLILMLIFNGLTALSYLLLGGFLASVPPITPMWTNYFFGVFALLNFVFTIFLFMWKRWAFFAFCVNAVIIFVINLVIGIGIVSALLGLSGPVILYLIMRSKWELFE